MNLRARVARALGQRLRHLCRVDVAVVGVVEARQDAVGLQERMARHHLGRSEHLELDALGARLRDHVPEFIDPVCRVRQAHAAGDVVVDLVANARRELRVQSGAVALQLDQVPGSREVRAVAGSVPGGAGRQLIALEQHRVGDAQLG